MHYAIWRCVQVDPLCEVELKRVRDGNATKNDFSRLDAIEEGTIITWYDPIWTSHLIEMGVALEELPRAIFIQTMFPHTINLLEIHCRSQVLVFGSSCNQGISVYEQLNGGIDRVLNGIMCQELVSPFPCY